MKLLILMDPYQSAVYPLYQTTTFHLKNLNDIGEYNYTRSGNPTRTIFENKLKELEYADYCYSFTTGMAAIDTIFKLLNYGDCIYINDDIYGGTYRLINSISKKYNIKVKFQNFTEFNGFGEVIPKIVLIESISNPLLKICDISNIAKICKENNSLLVVDNSALSPILCNPLKLGADIVIHSLSKYIGGHSDTMGGCILTNNHQISKEIKFYQNAQGNALAPFDCWLLLRGMETLELRIKKQQTSSLKVAKFLKRYFVKNVYYPGLKNHPNRNIHKMQSFGNGSIISFETGDLALSEYLVNNCKKFKISVSFGSTKSLISLPSKMSHSSIPKENRNFKDDLVRLSIGIEDVNLLIEDLYRTIISYEIKKMNNI